MTKGALASTPAWAGDLPAGWASRRVSTLADPVSGLFKDGDWIEAPFILDEGVRLIQTGNVGVGQYKEQGYRFISEQTFRHLKCTEVRPGDILISRLGDPVGRSCIAPNLGVRMITSVDVAILRTGSDLDARFVNYALSCRANLDWISSLVRGSTRDRVSRSMLGAFRLPLPPLSEQVGIANFLDQETAEIDAFIADQEELIALLGERRISVLIGETLGREATLRGPLGRFVRKESLELQGPNVVTAFRDGQVTARVNRREEGFTMSEADSGYQGVRIGDLVFHGLDGFAGAVGVADASGRCSPVYHVCSTTPSVDVEFMALYLRALGITGFLEAHAWSVRQRSVDYRNWAVFSKLPVAMPTIAEQTGAVRRVRQETAELDAAIADAREAIALSRERRAALISAAVTGKIDVREVA